MIKILCIFSNIDTSNVSSIQVNSLFNNFSKNITLEFYKIPDDVKTGFDLIDLKKINILVENLDKDKNMKNNEIKSLIQVEDKLKNNYYDKIKQSDSLYLS